MADYSKEGDAVKQRLFDAFGEWEKTEDYAGRKWKSRAQRAIKSVAGMTDDANPSGAKSGGVIDYIDNSLSKGKKTSSIMAGLGARVQNATDATAPLTVTPLDSMHHIRPLDTYGPSLRMQNGIVRLDFLLGAADQGHYFSETFGNIGGGSLHPKAHIGSTGKNTLARIFEAEGISGPASPNLSAHRTETQLDLKQFDSGSDMLKAAQPHFEHDVFNAEVGKAADAPRRRMVTEILTSENIIDSGVDLFAEGADPGQIKKAKAFLNERPDLLRAIDAAIDPKEARKLIKVLAGSSLLAVGVFGTGVDAAETALRTKLAAETKDPVDTLQAMISGLATTTGATGIGEVLGLPLEVVNMFIDTYREDGFKVEPNALEARTQQLQQSLQSNPKPTQEPKSEAGYETLGRLGSEATNNLQYAGKQVLKFFGGAIRMGSEAGF